MLGICLNLSATKRRMTITNNVVFIALSQYLEYSSLRSSSVTETENEIEDCLSVQNKGKSNFFVALSSCRRIENGSQ